MSTKARAKRKSEKAALRDKQLAFVEHYLQTWNAAEAARRAGYSKKTAREIGHENLTKPDIRAAIEKRLSDMAMGADEVLSRLSAHARGDISHFVVTRKDGEFSFDFSSDEAQAHLYLVKKMKQKRRLIHREDGDPIEEIETEFELHDPQAALVHLGRHHKLFVDRTRTETWEDDLVELLKAGEATADEIRDEFGEDIAARVIARAGLPPRAGREVQAP